MCDDAQYLDQFPDNSFDQIMAIDVLEHVIDLDMAVKSVIKKLKPGGRLIVSVPTHQYPKFFGQKFDDDIGHLRHFSYNSLHITFENYGLVTENIKPYTFYYTSKLCHFYYDSLSSTMPKIIFLPILNCFSIITERIHTKIYTELLAVFRKL